MIPIDKNFDKASTSNGVASKAAMMPHQIWAKTGTRRVPDTCPRISGNSPSRVIDKYKRDCAYIPVRRVVPSPTVAPIFIIC
mmetsp:Transcript_11974/g.16558  ORF Transcript_11974/g.16558 Transcript_11974/m.16558 type:complete len:82 (+) Transcript_11974:106-351(+)